MNVKDAPSSMSYCLVCLATTKLSRCSRCNVAYYCSRAHQLKHWSIHKKSCRPAVEAAISESNGKYGSSSAASNNSANVLKTSVTEVQSKFCKTNWKLTEDNVVENTFIESTTGNFEADDEHIRQLSQEISSACTDSPFVNAIGIENSENLGKLLLDGNDIFSSLSSECLSSSNDYWDILNECDPNSLALNFDLNIPSPKQSESIIQSTLIPPSISSLGTKSSASEPLQKIHNISLEDLCENIISDLNEYGICVLDNFLGSNLGDLICAEVNSLFMKGIFRKGELIGSSFTKSDNIRGDIITWVNGNEESCHYIGSLMKKLDVLMAASNKMPNNGVLGKYKLNRRTKAMIACYPGDGTHYKKHVDNPNGDGRCITCIYYLNKKWDIKTHGGMLRMFPVANNKIVANIEPIFDRMLFFWSDRRNPHEVLPSYAVRFAITVWYFDSDERDCALLKYRSQEC